MFILFIFKIFTIIFFLFFRQLHLVMTSFPVNDIQLVQNQIFFQSINLIKICNIHYINYYIYKQKENSHRGSIVLLIEFAMKISVYASMTCVLRIILRLLIVKSCETDIIDFTVQERNCTVFGQQENRQRQISQYQEKCFLFSLKKCCLLL